MIKKSHRLFIYLIALALIIALWLLLFVNFNFIGKKSIHQDAKRYQTRHCLAFYPPNGKDMAKQVCKDSDNNQIFDYSLVPYGDYYLVNYGGDNKYFVDKQYQRLSISDISDEGKEIILDYIRYQIKKDHPDQYYNSSYISSINSNAVDFTNASYEIVNEDLKCHLEQFDFDIYVPIKYLQKHLDMNFGFSNDLYSKPVYIDDHPIICLTFDGGPVLSEDRNNSSTVKIVDTLAKYDACGTFYITGFNLENREIWADYQVYSFLKYAINRGNEYGSHTQNNDTSLVDMYTAEEIYNEINGPIKYMREFMEYEMKTYRPVYGEFNDDVLNNQPVPAILWNIDSEDWAVEGSSEIYQKIVDSELESGDIIVFHDVYEDSAQAMERIIPYLIDKGYQLLTVNDMLDYYNIDINQLHYFYNPNYFE